MLFCRRPSGCQWQSSLTLLLFALCMPTLIFALSNYNDFDPNYHRQFRANGSLLDQAGGILYRQSIFTPQEFATIQSEVAEWKKNLQEETSSSVAQNRLGVEVPRDSETVQILQTGSMGQWVQKVAGSSSTTMELSSDLPVEIRTYEKMGAGMAWHEDDILYDPPQVEVVITLENTSDCRTMWKYPKSGSNNDDNQEVVAKETDPNSVLILLAGGPSHCVSSLKRGKRVILKCAYASKDAVYRQDLHMNQFQGQKTKSKSRSNKSSKRNRKR